MKILAILLIPLFWGIVSATPPFKEIHLINNELENHDNQQNQNKNLDSGVVIPDKPKFEFNDTRDKSWKRSIFPLFQKDDESSPDKKRIEDSVNTLDIILNGIKLGRKFIDEIVQSISKIIYKFNSDISNENKIHDIQKRENKKPRNVRVNNKKNKRLKIKWNLKNAKKKKIIDQEELHSIIPQIIVNNNQRSSKSRNNELSKKTDNNGFETKQKQSYTEAYNVQRNKRDTHTPQYNTLNKDNKKYPHNTDAVGNQKQTSIVESLNTGPALTKITQKVNAEAAEFNEFQMNVPNGEFSKWLDNTPGYYFDYSEPLDISPKYTPIATNIKEISTKTALNKVPDKSAPIKKYFQPDYEDSRSKWTNDKELKYYTDFQKSPITWQGGNSAVDETIPLPSERVIIDKTTDDNNNVKSNTNSISKATTSDQIADIHANIEDIPPDWIVKYKMMNNKGDDTLFFKVDSHTGDNVETNAGIGVVHEDSNKSLKTMVEDKDKSDKDVSKSVELTSTANTSDRVTISASHQKPSTLTVKDIIVNDKNNTTVVGDVINEYKEKQANWNITTPIVSDKNAFISDDKAAASSNVYSILSASNKNENQLSQYSMGNNFSNNQSNNIFESKINIKVDDKETKDQRENKNEQLTKIVTPNRLSNDKNNSTEVKEEILSKAVSSDTGITYSTENSNIYEIQVPSEWIVKYKSLDDTDYHSKLVISANSNASNSTTTEDPYKPTNWTNESKVTREPDDKWPSLEANAKTSAVQATAVSTEKIENLLNRRDEETKVLSFKDLTEKDETVAFVTAHSNLNESTIKKQTLLNPSEDKKLLNTKDNKVVKSIKIDDKTAVVTDNNKQKWESDNNETVLNVNSQLVASAASNTKATTISEREKEKWKWNDEDKNWIIKNDTISDNKIAVSVEANAYATAATDNNKQTLEKVKNVKNNVTLNNQAAASNADVAITISDDKHILKSDAKYNNPSIKDDNTLDNKATEFSKANVDTTEATDNINHQWRWNNEEETQSIKDNATLNNKVDALSAGNSKVDTSVTGNKKVSVIQSQENEWKLAKNNSELNIQNYDISNIEETATVKNSYNVEETTTDKKLSWISSEEEKYNVTLDNEETTTVQTYLTRTTTENDKQKWKWDNEFKDSSVKNKVLLNNQEETSALADSVPVTDNKRKIKHKEIESNILNDQNIVTLNNSEITSIETGITSMPVFKYDKLESDWSNKDNDQSVRNNDKSHNEIDSVDKVNRNTAKATTSNKDTWKWNSEDKVLSNKSNYLTANKTDQSSEKSAETSETTENFKLFNFNDKDEHSSEKKEIISNSKAATSADPRTNSPSSINNNKKESYNVRDYIIYNDKTAELGKVNVKDAVNIAHDIKQSKLEEKGSDLNVTDDVKSDKEIWYAENNTNVTAISTTENKKKQWELDNNNKTQIMKNDLNINDQATFDKSSGNATSTIPRNKQLINDDKGEIKDSNIQQNVTLNNKAFASTDAITNATTTFKKIMKQWTWVDNENQDVKEDSIYNTTAFAGSNANAVSTIANNKQQSNSNDEEDYLSIKNNVTSNNKAIESSEGSTVVAAVENDKKQWKSDNNKTQNVKDDLIINNSNASSAESNANAVSTIVLDKQLSRFNNEGNGSSVKKNKPLNKTETDSIEVTTDAKIFTENDKQQSKLNNQSNNSSITNDFRSSNKDTRFAEDNSNAKLTNENDKERLELDNKEEFQTAKYDVILKSQAAVSSVADRVTVAGIERVIKHLKLDNKEGNSNIKNVSSNSKSTTFARTKTDTATTISHDQQQRKLINEDKDTDIKDDVNIVNENILNLQNAESANVQNETTNATAVYENQKILDDINKNATFKVDITPNSGKATSARIDAEAKSKVILTKNNDNEKIFDEKTLEVSTLEPISETSSSIIDTADINLENKTKDSLSEYNINDKEARVHIDAISDLITNASATIIAKDSSARENKKNSTDEIAEKSESNIYEAQTDYINQTKEKLQSLELKNNNSIEYNNSMAVAGASASTYTEKEFNSSKESNNKLSDWNDKGNNKKDRIDEIANTKVISYNIDEGNVDTLLKDNTNTEWKIKGVNAQGHQNLVSQEKATVSVIPEAKDKSIIRDENKQVKNYSFNNDRSIANVKANTTAAVEAKVDPSYLNREEINKNSMKNTEESISDNVKSEIYSVKRTDDKQFDQNFYSKNLTNNTNLRTAIETKAESNSVPLSTSNFIKKQIERKYNEEKDSLTKKTIDGGNENLVITSSKEKEIINDLNKTSNNLLDLLLRWKSVNNAVESNKNKRQNVTEIGNGKFENPYDEKHTIDEIISSITLTDDKTKDNEKKMDDADLIVIKKPYGQQDTVGITYIKDSVPPMILFRVIPTNFFEQVRKLIKQWEIVHVSYAEP